MRKALVGVAALALSIGLMPAAQAADNPPRAQLMNVSDLADFGGVVSPRKWYWDIGSADTNLVNSVCLDSQGKPLTFAAANGWEAGGTVSLKPYTSVSEHVFDYGTAEAQEAAWQEVQTAAASCDTKSKERVSSGDPSVYYNVTQSVANVDGGVAVTERSVARSKDRTINGSSTVSYTTYRQSGTAIIVVAYYQNPGKTVSAANRAKVESLANTLAARWS